MYNNSTYLIGCCENQQYVKCLEESLAQDVCRRYISPYITGYQSNSVHLNWGWASATCQPLALASRISEQHWLWQQRAQSPWAGLAEQHYWVFSLGESRKGRGPFLGRPPSPWSCLEAPPPPSSGYPTDELTFPESWLWAETMWHMQKQPPQENCCHMPGTNVARLCCSLAGSHFILSTPMKAIQLWFSTWQSRKQRPREVWQLAQSLTIGKQQQEDLNPPLNTALYFIHFTFCQKHW
jgi:hypothetical protein